MKRICCALWLPLLCAIAAPAAAEPTDITVRVISRDAKFIGSSMGGVRITISDAGSGEILAQGLTEGGTGDTERLMVADRERGQPLATEGAAKFDATIDIDTPRQIKVSAYGPLDKPHAANTVSATQWVVPGRDLTGGDGWLLEMPGFVVSIVEAPSHMALGEGAQVPLKAHVSMMCGCPITPGGLWDADQYEVTALLRRDGEVLAEKRLAYAGQTSEFSGALRVQEAGVYDVLIYAYDAANGNTGLDRMRLVVTED